MTDPRQCSSAKDKTLFTPGPLTTSQNVKQAMLRDLGSRDVAFIEVVSQIRQSLLAIAGVSREKGYEAVLMQGSGTFGIESVIGSTTPPNGKWLVIINGAYGVRIAKIAEVLKIDTALLEYPPNTLPVPSDVDRLLTEDQAITNVAVVHCETTTGIVNPIEEIGQIVKRHEKVYFVDAMSAFGAVPFDFEKCGIDFLVSSANKCIEGVPGFSFAIFRRDLLRDAEGWARSLSLDLRAQWPGVGSERAVPLHTAKARDPGVPAGALRVASRRRRRGPIRTLPRQLSDAGGRDARNGVCRIPAARTARQHHHRFPPSEPSALSV